MIGKWHWPSALQMLIAKCAGVSKAEVALARLLAVIVQRMPLNQNRFYAAAAAS
jgi:hypothetical protein